jgi:hypothetical protein
MPATVARCSIHSTCFSRLHSPIALSFVAQHRIELDPRHIRHGDVCHVAPCTLASRCLRGTLGIGQGIVTEGETSPAVRLGRALTVLHRRFDAIERPIEEASPGGFGSRAVRKRRLQDQRQLFDNERAFRKACTEFLSGSTAPAILAPSANPSSMMTRTAPAKTLNR